jgi:hypothetical protein
MEREGGGSLPSQVPTSSMSGRQVGKKKMKEKAHHHDTVMTLVRFSLSFSVVVVWGEERQ